jgi:hypothetical protein
MAGPARAPTSMQPARWKDVDGRRSPVGANLSPRTAEKLPVSCPAKPGHLRLCEASCSKDVDGRDKRGHDTEGNARPLPQVSAYGPSPAMTQMSQRQCSLASHMTQMSQRQCSLASHEQEMRLGRFPPDAVDRQDVLRASGERDHQIHLRPQQHVAARRRHRRLE